MHFLASPEKKICSGGPGFEGHWGYKCTENHQEAADRQRASYTLRISNMIPFVGLYKEEY